MQGILFYWVSWALWIACTFLMNKSNLRTFFSFFLLLLIISAGLYISLPAGEMGAAFLMLYIGCSGAAAYRRLHRSLRFMVSALGITAGYTGIKLMQLFDPVWFTISPFFVLFMIIFIAAGLLGKSFPEKVCLFLIGICNGEMLYEYIILPVSGALSIGQETFLDFSLLGMAGFSIWGLMEWYSNLGNQTYQKPSKAKQSRNA
ncbi:hypothetical protein J9317_11695 [Metabacillus sp. KIGAM252]|uniref:Integral membrane protein n=1 Tax=Metabacillus flavus TaxID=2823519 RepID=A0ABS5LFG0_9BACI|nr:hypothetical protein [Metabacillus flavus]MBS2969427.1 hypothetical protein [Metabacillus flavus]